jgi:hypothetical protein
LAESLLETSTRRANVGGRWRLAGARAVVVVEDFVAGVQQLADVLLFVSIHLLQPPL